MDLLRPAVCHSLVPSSGGRCQPLGSALPVGASFPWKTAGLFSIFPELEHLADSGAVVPRVVELE